MSEAKDPAIKLFGKTIPVAEVPLGGGGGFLEASSSIAVEVEQEGDNNNNNISNIYTNNDMDVDPERANTMANSSSSSSSIEGDTDKDGEEEQDGDNDNKEINGEKPTDAKEEDGAQPVSSEEQRNSDATSGISENAKTPSVEKKSATLKVSKTEEQSETSNSQEKTSEASNLQEKTLKKPDKILPCPRCNSMDTKFCYYNNYNVNQPRHFCKNCQRYWTAGGTMRNVPVGAGRRKNKNSASHYRHINVSEALQTSRSDIPTIPTSVHAHHPSPKSNGTVLTFGSDAPLCESMASVLNLADKTMQNCTQNGFHKPEELRIPVPYGGGENGDNSAKGSSVTTSNSTDKAGKSGSQEQVIQTCQSFPPQIPCFPGAPWPYPWNSAQWSPPVPLHAFCPPGFPMPFYPAAAYWGCSVPGTWNIPWIPQPSSPNLSAPSSGPNSPTLGKHSRDENPLKCNSSVEEEPPKESNSERCLWIPKTLRIDDPGEAAKSSIWATLGIKNDHAGSVNEGGLYKAFQTKDNERNHIAENSEVLQANPAAMSRSLSFQESS